MRTQRGGKIAAMLLERQQTDARVSNIDRSAWYVPNQELLSPVMLDAFHLSFLDRGTQDFLDTSTRTSESFCVQSWYTLSTAVLSMFLTKTSINGVLNRGGMFIFSEEQLREFMHLPAEWDHKGKRLLDLGAGDGGVTKVLNGLYENVDATEMSTVMQWRLKSEGFNIVDVDNWHESHVKYDLISVLNLLDRHYNPRILLAQLHKTALRSGCPVLMAVVMPVKQYVEFHPSRDTTYPDNYIRLRGKTLEEQAGSLVELEFIPAGFELIRWTRLPYLCEGDFQRPFYLLNDVVFLLRAVPIPEAGGDNVTIEEVTTHQEL